MKISAIITKPFFKHSKLFVFAAIFAASLIAGTNVFAQNEDAPKGKKEEPGINQHGDQNADDPMGKRSVPPEVKTEPQILAHSISAMLKEKLSLTDKQSSGVYDIVLDYASTHENSNFDHSELDRKIEKILTADQVLKYKEFVKNGPDRNAPQHHGNDDSPVR